jgi:hypothetical protein
MAPILIGSLAATAGTAINPKMRPIAKTPVNNFLVLMFFLLSV